MPRIVITNDDGIGAPGLEALFRAAEGLGERTVVAPEECCSGAGHRVTTKEPILIRTLRDGWHAVGGTPADCSRIALSHIEPGAQWVLAGINRGGNLGADVYTSGTVAAAREGALLGRRAIAVSQYVRPDLPLDWGWTRRACERVLPVLLSRPPRPGWFWNVNLPHLSVGSPVPEMTFCALDPGPLDVRFRIEGSADGTPRQARYEGNYHARRREPGRDVDVCFGGRIAVTEIPLDVAGEP